jgi:hypothetical protein
MDFDFKATSVTGPGWIGLYFGAAGGQYAIRNLSLVPEASVPARPRTVSPSTSAVSSAGWAVETVGTAQAGQIFSADGVIIDVDRNDGNAGDVALADDMAQIANGKTYTVHFRARSPQSPMISIEARDAVPGRPIVGLQRTLALTPEWQEFNVTFTAANDLSNHARIAVLLGGISGTVEFANVSFGEQAGPTTGQAATASTPAVPITLAPPGSLPPVASWALNAVGSTVANLSPSSGGAIVEIDRADGNPNDVVLSQDGVDLADGKTYDLVFKAKSSVTREIPVVAQVDDNPSRLVGLQERMHVTPEWQAFDLKFTAVQPIPSHSRIAFLLGATTSVVDLSDVALSATVAAQPTQTALNIPGD